MNSQIKVMGFDLDNTLYPVTDKMQGRIRKKIYGKIASELGIPFDRAQQLFEDNYNGSYEWSGSGSRTIAEIAKQHGRNCSKEDGSEIVQESIEEADILNFIHPNPALKEMLKRLSERFILDLITGSSLELTLQKLERIGLNTEIFENIFSGKNYGYKTDGSVYRNWLRLRGNNPKEHLYVGDNKKQDIVIPKSLGIITCFVGLENSDADYTIRDILGLEDVLRK